MRQFLNIGLLIHFKMLSRRAKFNKMLDIVTLYNRISPEKVFFFVQKIRGRKCE